MNIRHIVDRRADVIIATINEAISTIPNGSLTEQELDDFVALIRDATQRGIEAWQEEYLREGPNPEESRVVLANLGTRTRQDFAG